MALDIYRIDSVGELKVVFAVPCEDASPRVLQEVLEAVKTQEVELDIVDTKMLARLIDVDTGGRFSSSSSVAVHDLANYCVSVSRLSSKENVAAEIKKCDYQLSCVITNSEGNAIASVEATMENVWHPLNLLTTDNVGNMLNKLQHEKVPGPDLLNAYMSAVTAVETYFERTIQLPHEPVTIRRMVHDCQWMVLTITIKESSDVET